MVKTTILFYKKIDRIRKTRKTETSKYPKEKKSTEILWVVVSESREKVPIEYFGKGNETRWKSCK